MNDFDLIELISEAALDPRRWPPVAAAFCTAAGCDAVLISACPGSGPPVSLAGTAGYAPPAEADIAAAQEGDLAADPAAGLPALHLDRSAGPEHFHFMRLAAPAAPAGCAAIALHCRGAAPWRGDLARLRRIQRYLALAAGMAGRIPDSGSDPDPAPGPDGAGGGARTVLDRLPFPILVVTETGELRFANRAGQDIEIVSQGAIRRNGDRIEIADPALRARLEPAIGLAAALAAGTMQDRRGIVVDDAAVGARFRVEIRPIRIAPAPGAAEAPAAMVCLHRTARQRQDVPVSGLRAALETGHGLTPAEAELALAILRGQTLAGHAAARGVSLNTVRSQLRRVFSKTGCRRQAELVRRFLPASRTG